MKTVTEPMFLAALKAAHLMDTPVSRRDMTNAIEAALKEREGKVYRWLDEEMGELYLPSDNRPEGCVPLYAAPPKAQPMSDEQADQLADRAFIGYMENTNDDDARALVRSVERHHKITGE